MNSVTVRCLASLLCGGLVVAGCSPATTSRSTSHPSTTTTSQQSSVLAACVDVADKTGALLTVVGRLATGEATVEQVRAAAADLSASFDDAMATIGPDARANLDDAGQALGRIQTALSTQPIDTAALRTAADDLFTALGSAANVCAPSSSPRPTESISSGESTEDSSTSTKVSTTGNSVTTTS